MFPGKRPEENFLGVVVVRNSLPSSIQEEKKARRKRYYKNKLYLGGLKLRLRWLAKNRMVY